MTAARRTRRTRRTPRARLGAVARVAVGSVLVVGVLFVAVFPTRTYLDQRETIDDTGERLAVLRRETARLRDEARRLHTDAEIERIARERYNLARPGEEVFVIIPDAPPAPTHVDPYQRYAEPVQRLWGIAGGAGP